MQPQNPGPVIRQASLADLDAIAGIYERIHDAEESGPPSTGWKRGIYPTTTTARAAIEAGEMFVLEDEGEIRCAGILNQSQLDVYRGANWRYPANDQEVMVLHTLTVDPLYSHHGYGRAFLNFYDRYAAGHHCPCLRMDVNVTNKRARAFYKKMGFQETAIVSPPRFNGISGIKLGLLEKLSGEIS